MPDYFFSGTEYIRVTRGTTGPGTIDPGYPAPISAWGWSVFGAHGIDAALYSGTKCYFFSGKEYIRVTRGEVGAGTVDPGYPKPISGWGWGSFGANGIDAALNSGPKDYFFSGKEYIRVTRGDTGPGTVDPGYPKAISGWGWGSFGANGIDAALYSGPKCYFFSGGQYIRVTRGDTGAGTIDPGYPKPISVWGWGSFGAKGINAALFSGTDYFVAFQVEPQLESEWCWAAVSTSVAHYYVPSSKVTQCEVVNQQLNRTDCCSSPGSNSCNQPGYLDQALQYVGNFASEEGQGSFQDLTNALSSGTPPCIRIGWSGGGGHFIGVYGCQAGDLILVTDPIYGDSIVTYDTLTGGAYQGSGTWTNTYFTQL
jgi:Hemopexin/Papain-like cysteine protease AvrRpt2